MGNSSQSQLQIEKSQQKDETPQQLGRNLIRGKLETDCKRVPCQYWEKCFQFLLERLDLNYIEMDHHICFCKDCHKNRKDEVIYPRGKPAKSYEIPVGFAGFAIQVGGQTTTSLQQLFSTYHNCFHGTIETNFNSISKCQMRLSRPGDLNSINEMVKIRTDNYRFQKDQIRINPYTNEQYNHVVNRIFTSPCIHYAAAYSTVTESVAKFKGDKYAIVLQCRIKPDSYELGPNTSKIEVGEETYCENKLPSACIEYMLDDREAIVITRVLIKVE